MIKIFWFSVNKQGLYTKITYVYFLYKERKILLKMVGR